MKARHLSLVVLQSLLLSACASTSRLPSYTLEEFQEYVASIGLRYSMPEGFHVVPVKSNRDMGYDFAVMSPDSTFEIRYAIWPLENQLKRYKECGERPGCVMIHPNELHNSLALVNVLNLTGLRGEKINRFPSKAVRADFNADAGCTSAFRFDCEFGEGYEFGELTMLHKDDVADIIITYMGRDLESLLKYIMPSFRSIVFVDN